MKTPSNNPVGTAAQSAVKAQFELLSWGVAPNPEHDLGTDHWVMARDDKRVDVRRLVGWHHVGPLGDVPDREHLAARQPDVSDLAAC